MTRDHENQTRVDLPVSNYRRPDLHLSVYLDGCQCHQSVRGRNERDAPPGSHLVKNINNLFSSVDMWQALWNSAKISVVTTVLSLLVASAAGYGFEMYRAAADIVFNILLASMMIPFAAIMVPLFQMFAKVSGLYPF